MNRKGSRQSHTCLCTVASSCMLMGYGEVPISESQYFLPSRDLMKSKCNCAYLALGTE
jgi:hypothetical protein